MAEDKVIIVVEAQEEDGRTEVRIRFRHEMLPGYGIDRVSDVPVAPSFIQQLEVNHKQRAVFKAHLSTGVSTDPFFSFVFLGAHKGEQITISWQENSGKKGRMTRAID